MILPRPKQATLGERHPIAVPLTVFCADAPSTKAIFPFHEMTPSVVLSQVEEPTQASFRLSVVPGISPNAEAYKLRIERGTVSVRAKDYRGMIHALATVAQLLQYKDGEITLPDAEIYDFPDTPFRSFMTDPARNLIPMDETRALILSMAKAKLNKLHLHLSDSTGFAYASDLNVPRSPKGFYTKEELQEIVWYADQFGIDVIPEVDVPAHGFALTELRPSLKCQVKGEDGGPLDVSGWNMCLGSEETYELIDALLAELAGIFPYEYIHVGTDEMDMRDLMNGKASPISHCEECERCRAFFSPLGLSTLCERFYWFINRVYSTVTSLGKRMILWNDDIDISKDPPIPHDILIEFWRVAAENRGPVEGCSMQRFLEEGFEVINADFPNTYVDEYVTWSKLKKWDPYKDPADAEARAHQMLGGEMCAWEGSNYPHYLYALYFAIPAFGDRLWCTDPIPEGKEATVALTRAALGMDTPEDLDIFEGMQDVPLGTAYFWEGGLIKDPALASAAEELLTSLSHQSEDEAHLTKALLQKIR